MKFGYGFIVGCLAMSACAGLASTERGHEKNAVAGKIIEVEGYTSAAIQAAVDRAQPGDTVRLPAGDSCAATP